jgi:hypothetical protein
MDTNKKESETADDGVASPAAPYKDLGMMNGLKL